jgi:hypothetical protein
MLWLEGTSGGAQVLAGLGVAMFGSGTPPLVLDHYNTAANGTPLTSETPAIGPVPSGVGVDFTIQSGTAQVVTANGVAFNWYDSLGQHDCTSSAFLTFGSGGDLGFIMRTSAVDISLYWYVAVDPGSQQLEIWENSDTSFTQMASVGVGPVSGSGFAVSAATSGTTISGNFNSGQATVSFNSSDYQNNQGFGIAAGIITSGTSADNFGTLTITHP